MADTLGAHPGQGGVELSAADLLTEREEPDQRAARVGGTTRCEQRRQRLLAVQGGGGEGPEALCDPVHREPGRDEVVTEPRHEPGLDDRRGRRRGLQRGHRM